LDQCWIRVNEGRYLTMNCISYLIYIKHIKINRLSLVGHIVWRIVRESRPEGTRKIGKLV
jgi:hypothetical protein